MPHHRSARFRLILLLLALLMPGCTTTPAPTPAQAQAPAAAPDPSEVVVMGMIHGRHLESDRYGTDRIRAMVRAIKPDFILCEIPPDRFDAAVTGFETTGAIAEPRVARFPEYTDAVFPLTREMNFEIIPCAAWTADMAERRRERLAEWETSRPTESGAVARAQREASDRIEAGGADDDPAWIHTDAYDRIVRRGMQPYNALFNDDLGPGGWHNINAAHYALIERALDEHRGEGHRFLIMFGAWHKYWFLDRLREREDVVLTSPLAFGVAPPPVPHSTPRTMTCPHLDAPLTIDGRLDDDAWSVAPWSDLFIDIEGNRRPVAPRHDTRMAMLWDDDYLYVGAWMIEPDLWGRLTERDAVIWHDNDFEVFIDPDGDRENYLEIEINALGTIFDLLLVRSYINGGPARHDWNVEGLRSAVHLRGTLNDPSDTDDGWSVEIAIPWTHLDQITDVPCPPEDGDTWRMNFSRVQWTLRPTDTGYEKLNGLPEDNWVWSPQGAINMHIPERWGYVTFDAAPPAAESLTPIPATLR